MYNTQETPAGYLPDIDVEQLGQYKDKKWNENEELTNTMKEMGIMKTLKFSKIFILGNKLLFKT